MSNGNAAIYFVDRHVQEGRGAKTVFTEHAIGGEGRSLTYGELASQSDCMADLYARHGITREDRAAMIVLDTIEFPIIFWGSLKAGVIPVPINTLLATDVYGTILEDSRARALFVSHELFATVEPLLAEASHLAAVFVIGGETPAGTLSFADELEMSGPREPLVCDGDECAFWLYSSGSTGKPKGVRHVHSNLKATSDTYGAHVLAMQESDHIYSAAKFFFAYGLGNSMTFPMAVGASVVILAGRPTPDGVIDILETHKPSIFFGVPTLYAALGATLEGADRKLDCDLRLCASAGEALPEEVGKRWEAVAGCEICEGIGSTEMLHIFVSNAPGDVVYGTTGVAVPGYDIRIVNEEDADVAPGEIGEMLVRGDSAASDYWNQRAKSRSTFTGEWARTGDKFEHRADGRFVYCGRTDDMFKVSGIWVSPFEVEQAIVSHPAVLEAAVVAARDEDDLEKPKAFVVLKGDGGDGFADDLREHVKERIGKWKYPRWVIVTDELPKTSTGKIQRFKLRDTA